MYVWLACSRNDNQQKQFMDGCLGRNARCFLQKLHGQRHAAALKTPLADSLGLVLEQVVALRGSRCHAGWRLPLQAGVAAIVHTCL